MHESKPELDELQALLDRSAAKSGEHLRSTFGQDGLLGAADLVKALPGIFEAHLAVLSGSGAPLVAPVDGILFRGKVWVSLPAAALRSRLLRRDQRVSVSYNAPPLALIVHGTAQEVAQGDPLLEEFGDHALGLYGQQYGAAWLEWRKAQRPEPMSTDFTGYIEPRVMFAKA